MAHQRGGAPLSSTFYANGSAAAPPYPHSLQHEQEQHGPLRFVGNGVSSNGWNTASWQPAIGLPMGLGQGGMPPAFPGFQLAPSGQFASQGFMPQQMPFHQGPDYIQDPPYYQGSMGGQFAMSGNYPPYGAQQQPQPQGNLLQNPGLCCGNGHGYRPNAGFQPAFPSQPYFGNRPRLAQHGQWSAQPAWANNKEMLAGPDGFRPLPQTDQSSSGRTPNKLHNFAGNGRGWKRNREGNMNGSRHGAWQNNGNFSGATNRVPALRCETCDRNFVGFKQLDVHMKTHTKCNEEGCSFEGIGRVVSEHRLQAHFKMPPSARHVVKDSDDDIRRWREARRKNYPTTSNLHKKFEELQARRKRGELVNEDALKRQESLKEILARQAELGCPVAEVPPYYFSNRYTQRGLANIRNGRQGERPANEDASFEEGEIPTTAKRHGKKICQFFQQGHCKKGRRCGFLHASYTGRKEFRNKKQPDQNGQAPQRGQTLLAKLFSPEIRRDKSHLLQCFRFFVNNNFLLEDCPLKFFEWSERDDESKAVGVAAPLDLIVDVGDSQDDDLFSEGDEEDAGNADSNDSGPEN